MLRRGPVAAEPSVLTLPGCGALGRGRPRRSLTPPRGRAGRRPAARSGAGGGPSCRAELPPAGLQPVTGREGPGAHRARLGTDPAAAGAAVGLPRSEA